ncbi:arylmalonate decarboxylase [Yaniella flava]|uniref:Arylmalonate decarboxylase n=1 Tax=Yaniella flava TaxID=287930 RepID=A0ABP5FW89_9MICC|nr:maleate cis-trans isomerase [Micrococcaceae bacterium]
MTTVSRPETTVGMIYPDHAAEDDYPRAAAWLDVHLPVVHVYGTDLHAVPELLDLGRPERLAEAAEKLAVHRPQAVMWACTSGSFVYGLAGAQQQADQLALATGVPAASTSQAFVAALGELGVHRVAVAASYPQPVATLFVEYLVGAGIDITAMSSAGIDTAAEVGGLTPDYVLDLALSNDHPAADALLIPDTAMRTVQLLPELEAQLGKPVLTANQITIWHGLRLAGAPRHDARLGTLFAP